MENKQGQVKNTFLASSRITLLCNMLYPCCNTILFTAVHSPQVAWTTQNVFLLPERDANIMSPVLIKLFFLLWVGTNTDACEMPVLLVGFLLSISG